MLGEGDYSVVNTDTRHEGHSAPVTDRGKLCQHISAE